MLRWSICRPLPPTWYYLQKNVALRTQATLIQLAQQHKEIYNAAIEACWELHQKKQEDHYLEKAFEFAERSRALLLRLSANNVMIDASRVVHSTAEEKDLFWRKRISSLNTQYLDTDKKSDSLLTLLTASMEEYYRFQDSMLRSGDESIKLKYSLSPASIPDIQKKLRKNGQTLLQYAVTGRHVFIFVLNGRRLVAHRLAAGILHEVNALKQLHNILPEKFSTAAFRLYESLIRPVEKNFASDKLIIIPDGELFYLNFELLLSDHISKDFSKMKYLLYRYEISYQLTATAAVQTRVKRNAEKKDAPAPVFTDAMKVSLNQ